jgi:heme-degrading monooxygenase HmoA
LIEGAIQPMPEIESNTSHVTQITIAEAEDGKQEELVALMTERAQFMAGQPGFVSISVHRSLDGKRIVNYVQWASREQLVAAHHTPEFREKWPLVGDVSENIILNLYEVAHIEER